MSGLVYRSLGNVGDNLVVIDAARHVYAGLSRDASYLHLVHPAPVDMVNAENAVIRSAGQLVCTCAGSAYRGRCYRTDQAEAFEAGTLAPAHGPHCDADLRRNGCVCTDAWLRDAAPGEITEAYGS